MRRRGVTDALLAGVAMLFLVGIVWAVLYYGGYLSTRSEQLANFGSGQYDPLVFQFVDLFMAWWPFLVGGVGLVLWWWAQSNKRDLTY